MPVEPLVKRTIAFLDGQNLFYAARDAFGYTYPNYDPLELARSVCALRGWDLVRVHFYTGLPSPAVKKTWHDFWSRKLAVMGTRGIHTFTLSLIHI